MARRRDVWWVPLTGVALAVLVIPSFVMPVDWWVPFLGLAALAGLTQLFIPLFLTGMAGSPTHRSFSAFLFAGVLLLPMGPFVLLVVFSHLVEWAHRRAGTDPRYRPGLVEYSNLLTHAVAGLVAWALYHALRADRFPAVSPVPLLTILCAITAYVAVQHIVSGQVQVLVRGLSWQATGALRADSLLPDFFTCSLGAAAALLWTANPWQILLMLPTLVLLDRALQVPALKREARTDSKTGLLNARAFNEVFVHEFGQAERSGQPLTMIMADLDLLRNINNSYGHLAGDAVLATVGQAIAESIREDDIAGRFGGEEFAIVLPDTALSVAMAVAERVRQAVATSATQVETSDTLIHVTVSLGLACFPEDATKPQKLIHAADMAVYQAKLRGRNCVVAAADVPHFVRLQPTLHDVHDSANGSAAVAPPAPPLPAKPPPAAHDPQRLDPPAPATDASPAPPRAAPAPGLPIRVRVFIGGVVGLAVIVTAFGSIWGPAPDLIAISLFAVLTAIFEVLQVDVYGDNTLSVATAAIFATALISGMPGVAVVSAVVALTHYVRQRPALHATAFNWAVHLLAGTIPILLISALGIAVQIENLPLLAIPVAVACLIYFVVDTGLIAGIIGVSTQTRIPVLWQKQFQWLAPHYLVLGVIGLFLDIAYTKLGPAGVLVFTLPVIMMRYVQQQYVEHTKESMHELKRLNGELAQANREIVVASHAIQELNDELFLTLAKILDARDPYVGGHAAQVSRYATAIATKLGLPAERIELLRQAGFLHDIGKIAIAEHILHKPSRLTEEEYEYIKTHTAIGADLLETSRALRHLAPFVRGHHERWDGKGYPQGLRRDEIPLEARILAVCDAVEAMASDRPYQRGKSVDEVIAEVQRCSATHFDPQVVDVFVELARREGADFIINSAREVTRKQGEGAEVTVQGDGWPLPLPDSLAPLVVARAAPGDDAS